MSASDPLRASWLEPALWDRLKRLEDQHQKLQCDHERARRRLERLRVQQQTEELSLAWRQYCDVIAELDKTTAEFEALRTFKG